MSLVAAANELTVRQLEAVLSAHNKLHEVERWSLFVCVATCKFQLLARNLFPLGSFERMHLGERSAPRKELCRIFSRKFSETNSNGSCHHSS